MTFVFLPHVIFLALLALISAITSYLAWQRRSRVGSVQLAWAGGLGAFWSLCAGIEAGIVGQSAKIFWSQVGYVGFTTVVHCLFLFVTNYTRRSHWITGTRQLIFWIIPFATILLAWTNSWHHLIWLGFQTGDAAANVLIYQHGPAFWVYTSYAYVLFLLAIIQLGQDTLRSQPPYKKQNSILLAASFLPALAGILYLTGLNPVPGLDWTPIGTTAAGIVFAYTIYQGEMFDLLPIARTVFFEQQVDSVIVLDSDRRIADMNRSAEAMLGVRLSDWFGRPLEQLLGAETGLSLPATLAEGQVDYRSITRTGRPIEVQISSLTDKPARLSGWLLVLRDITERKMIEQSLWEAQEKLIAQLNEIELLQEQLQEQAIRDSLTGLYNRRFMSESLERELDKAHRDRCPVVVAMIDLDHFKRLNDTYGHKAGDLVLQSFSEYLRQNTRAYDIICRYGGEEFLLVIPQITLEAASQRAECWRRGWENHRVEYQGNLLQSTISIGLAVYPADGASGEDLVKAADEALYRAKDEGRNRVCSNLETVGQQA